jgi:hypothetical protein
MHTFGVSRRLSPTLYERDCRICPAYCQGPAKTEPGPPMATQLCRFIQSKWNADCDPGLAQCRPARYALNSPTFPVHQPIQKYHRNIGKLRSPMTLSIQLSSSDYRALCDGASLLGRSPSVHAARIIAHSLHTQGSKGKKAKLPQQSEEEFLASTRNQSTRHPSSVTASFRKAAQTK